MYVRSIFCKLSILSRVFILSVTVLLFFFSTSIDKANSYSLGGPQTRSQSNIRLSTIRLLHASSSNSDINYNNKCSVSVPQNYRQRYAKLGKATTASMLSILTVMTTMKATPAQARFFASDVQNKVDQIAAFQRPINDLLDQLKPVSSPNAIGIYSNTQILRGGKEDANVVLTYLSTYIQPLQQQMATLAPLLSLPSAEAQEKAEVKPLLMKGHIAELNQAINEMNFLSQAKEITEVQETLAEFLKLAALKYEVTPFVPTRPLTDAELFGPLGCEFWGKKRAEGSNACIEK